MSDVYFLFAPRANAIKIGVASDPRKRIRNLQTPEPCRLVGVMPGVGVEGEQALHGDFKSIRVHGEWFKATPELRSYVESHASEFPVEAWTPVPRRRQQRRGTSHPQAGQKRRNRAIEAAANDRMFYVYECYGPNGEFLFVARSIKPQAHWTEQTKYARREWATNVAKFRVRGPYTRAKAAELYAEAVERDPIHVSSAPTAKAAEQARRLYVQSALRVRMERGETWDQAIAPALEEADEIDFRALVSK
ncbi:GIY-YIG nuclease family protein [Rhodococcus sp. NPDC057297]|uniref:GIY-YIG nuclease family protein n=1 Tax=Rhodococcus sp. NPDC057297 TaxID=3346090 RepID=UPI00362D0CD3